MLAVMSPLTHDVVFVHCNQMRANIGGYEEIYPGGYALKHGTHLRLRTRREGWIKEGAERIGFTMEVSVGKNKVGIPYGECQIGFRFKGQLDLISAWCDQGISMKLIAERIPWYEWQGQKWMGKGQMREYFTDNKGAFALLKKEIEKTEAAA
jgi:hypothetical protein